jgi:hypothetical protein
VSPGIPEDVRNLVQSSITSLRQLDLLLFMRQAGESRTWSAAELETALRSSPTAVDADLAGLLQARLIQVIVGPPTLWQYAPGDRRRVVDALAEAYRTHRTSIIRFIASQPSSAGALDGFADAFRLRRKDEHGNG